MRFGKLIAPVAAASLTLTSSIASAAGTVSAVPAAVAATCGSSVTAGVAATAQAARPGCVLPAIDAGPPVSTEAVAIQGGQPFLGGLLLPLLGIAGLAALVLALRSGGDDDGDGSLSQG